MSKDSLLALALLGASSTAAAAYFDPGTGSLLLQLLIAGALTAAASVKFYWMRIKEFVRRVFGSKAAPPRGR
jgi:hypothetical protein